MNKVLLILLLMLNGCTSFERLFGGRSADSSSVKVLVAAGQSNMLGYYQWTSYSELTGLNIEWGPNCQEGVSAGHKVGPAYVFGMQWIAEHPNDRLIILQCAVASSKMKTWVPEGENYKACLQFIGNHKDQVIGLLFYQGEADAKIDEPTYNHDWPSMFEAMVDDFRDKVGYVPVVFAQLGQQGLVNPNLEPFKQLQATIHLNNVRMIKTDDQPILDNVHHDSEANKVIGRRFYEAFGEID